MIRMAMELQKPFLEKQTTLYNGALAKVGGSLWADGGAQEGQRMRL